MLGTVTWNEYVFQCTPTILPNTVRSPVMVRSGVFS